MKRFEISPRADWQSKVSELGFIWHTANDVPYWNESAYYSFTSDEISQIETATEECHKLFLEAGQHVIDKNLFHLFGIPEKFVPLILEAWEDEPPTLNYGRFDFGFNGVDPPKLFEYNCDTPTSLVEASVIQWLWKEEIFPHKDQFNSIHEKLIDRWKRIKAQLPEEVHFTHFNDESGEDAITTSYLMDTAHEAGIIPVPLLIENIGFDHKGKNFLDQDNQVIKAMYKLYPWEWLVREEFGNYLLERKFMMDSTLWLEPIWKMIWSNKAILPILWELNKGHENLLWADFNLDYVIQDSVVSKGYVKKPILAREGSNVELIKLGKTVAKTEGNYGDEDVIYQQLYSLPEFDKGFPVIGSWCINGFAAGMGIREDGLITGNTANFIPHIIED